MVVVRSVVQSSFVRSRLSVSRGSFDTLTDITNSYGSCSVQSLAMKQRGQSDDVQLQLAGFPCFSFERRHLLPVVVVVVVVVVVATS